MKKKNLFKKSSESLREHEDTLKTTRDMINPANLTRMDVNRRRNTSLKTRTMRQKRRTVSQRRRKEASPIITLFKIYKI